MSLKVKTTHGGVVRIPHDINVRLDALCEATGRSKAYYVTHALHTYLKDMQAYLNEADPVRKEQMARDLRLVL